MGPILVRIGLLAAGLALGEIGLTSFAAGEPIWLLQLGFSIILIVAGSAGFMAPLLGGHGKEVRSDA